MITFLLPEKDYDPTESGVIWSALVESGVPVQFATPEGKVALADERLTDKGFGLLSPFLMTQKADLKIYQTLVQSSEFLNPINYESVDLTQSQGIFVPGGHAQGMKSLLESKAAQAIVVQAFDKKIAVGSVCHGVLLLARSINPKTGKSVLFGRQTTGLTRPMEISAWFITWLWLRNYYRTYDISVETEIKQALESTNDFKQGPILPIRDSAMNLKPGFTVCDDNYISGRWPGDCHKLAQEFVALVKYKSRD